ncbi:MAG: MMPL family transporter [Pseudomonadota bacterium]
MNNSGWLVAPGLLSIRKPKTAAMFLLLSVLASLFALPALKFDEDVYRGYSSGNIYSDNYETLIKEFGYEPSELIVLVTSDKRLTASDFLHIRDLTLELNLAEGITSVFSIASVRFPARDANYPSEPLIPLEITDSSLNQRLNAFESHSSDRRSVIAKDRKSTLIAIELDTSNGKSVLETSKELKKIVVEAKPPHLTFRFTGSHVLGPEIVSALKQDLIFFIAAGALVGFAIAWWTFGNIRLLVLAFLPTILATLVSLLAYTATGLPITVASNVIPVLVLVLALADSVHLTCHFRDNQECGTDLRLRVIRAVKEVGPACALTAATTAIAFATISSSSNTLLREFALTGAISVIVAYLVVITAFPLTAALIGKAETKSLKPQRHFISDQFCQNVLKNHKGVLAITLVLIAVIVPALFRLEPWYNLNDNLPVYSEAKAANTIIEEEFGGYFKIWSELTFAHPGSIENKENWDALSTLSDQVSHAAPESTVISLPMIAQWLGSNDTPPKPDIFERVPAPLAGQLVSTDGNRARVLAIVPEPMASPASIAVQRDMEKMESDNVRIIGLPVVIHQETLMIVRHLTYGLAVAMIIVILSLSWYYRWPRLAVILILPNTLPLGVAAISLHIIADGELTPTALLALTIAFGVAVDDSIHLINRFVTERNKGKNADEAIDVALIETGNAMVITSLLVCFGVTAILFSGFVMVRLFGFMLITAFVTALIADLLLLPVLLRIMQKPSGERLK